MSVIVIIILSLLAVAVSSQVRGKIANNGNQKTRSFDAQPRRHLYEVIERHKKELQDRDVTSPAYDRNSQQDQGLNSDDELGNVGIFDVNSGDRPFGSDGCVEFSSEAEELDNPLGIYGNLAEAVSEVEFEYEMETTAGLADDIIQERIIPSLESMIAKNLAQAFLPVDTTVVQGAQDGSGNCGNNGTRRQMSINGKWKRKIIMDGKGHRKLELLKNDRNSTLHSIVGVSPAPPDKIIPDSSCSKTELRHADDCVPCRGGMTVFLVEGLSSSEQDSAHLEIISHVQSNMDSDAYIDADPDLRRVRFVRSTVINLDGIETGTIVRVREGGSNEPVSNLPFILIGVAGALIAAVFLLFLRRQREKDGEEDDEDDPRDRDIDLELELNKAVVCPSAALARSQTQASTDLTLASSASFNTDSTFTMGTPSTLSTPPTGHMLDLTPMLGDFEDDDGRSSADEQLLFSPVDKGAGASIASEHFQSMKGSNRHLPRASVLCTEESVSNDIYSDDSKSSNVDRSISDISEYQRSRGALQATDVASPLTDSAQSTGESNRDIESDLTDSAQYNNESNDDMNSDIASPLTERLRYSSEGNEDMESDVASPLTDRSLSPRKSNEGMESNTALPLADSPESIAQSDEDMKSIGNDSF